jgi:hypothetical protein
MLAVKGISLQSSRDTLQPHALSAKDHAPRERH